MGLDIYWPLNSTATGATGPLYYLIPTSIKVHPHYNIGFIPKFTCTHAHMSGAAGCYIRCGGGGGRGEGDNKITSSVSSLNFTDLNSSV